MKKYYAGIGSRDTPSIVLDEMTKLSGILETRGYILRSGGAEGADTAFAKGTNSAQIWVPDGLALSYLSKNTNHQYKILDSWDARAWESIKKFHPNESALSSKGRALHARNYRQVIGSDLNEPNSLFVVCWTKDGGPIGGSGQAIRIAKHYSIPVFNYFNLNTDEILREIDKFEILNDY